MLCISNNIIIMYPKIECVTITELCVSIHVNERNISSTKVSH